MTPIRNHLPIEPHDGVADRLDRMRQTLNAAMSMPPEML